MAWQVIAETCLEQHLLRKNFQPVSHLVSTGDAVSTVAETAKF